MPNTPALVGAGISVFTDSGKLSENDAKITLEILSSIGKALPVAERMLDAVTGLSGCGPAYVFDFLIALAAGACTLPEVQAAGVALCYGDGAGGADGDWFGAAGGRNR